MNGLGGIAFGVGLQDGLNPCIFMTCAAFIVYELSFNLNSIRAVSFRIIFGLAYVLGVLAFNFGPAQILVFQKNFIFLDKILYFVLGAWAFVLGILFFKDWFLLSRGLPAKVMAYRQARPFLGSAPVIFLTTVVLAVFLSAMASLCPINTYFMLLGNAAILKGQWQLVLSLLIVYVMTSMWPLWFLWAILSIKNLRPSFFRILCAAIFFTASTTMIFIFK